MTETTLCRRIIDFNSRMCKAKERQKNIFLQNETLMDNLKNEREKLIILLLTKFKNLNVNAILANERGCNGIVELSELEGKLNGDL